MKIRLDQIRTDGGTQPRVTLDFGVVDDYAEAMQRGEKFPPVDVVYDGTAYWLYDGFHRVRAAWQNDIAEIEANVHQGTHEEAQWLSFGVNKNHGCRRSNEDKQRAVKAALRHPNGAGKSDREIARHIGVDQKTVLAWRGKLELSEEIPQIANRTVTRNGTTYQQNTANIGHKPEPKQEAGRLVEMTAAAAQPEPAAAPPRFTPPSTLKPVAKPEPQIDETAEAWQLQRALFTLASHKVSASAFLRLTPAEDLPVLYEKARAALEFLGFVFDGAANQLSQEKRA